MEEAARLVGVREEVEEEAFLILHSGEIPEVAFYSSIHWLTQDPEGPRLELLSEEILHLKRSVLARYRKILLRDLDPRMRGRRAYRGLARAKVNWERLKAFAERECLPYDGIREEARAGLLNLLQAELRDRAAGRGHPVNLDWEGFVELAGELGLSISDLPEEVKAFFEEAV